MAAQHSSIWSRMGDWLKHGGRATDGIVTLADHTGDVAERASTDHVPRNGENGLGNGHGPLASGHGTSPSVEDSHPDAHHAERNGGLGFFPGRKRQEQAIQRLEQGYQEVVGVIGAIHRHLQTQEERTREIADSLKSLAATMDRLPAAATSQGETLNAIAYQMQLTSERARRSEESLARLPELVEGQKEAMTAMAKQFDAAHQRDGRMTDTMDGLRKSVDAMGTAASTSTEVLKTLHQRGTEREGQLAELVKAQGRRYAWLFVITLVCSGIAAAVGTIALLQRI